MPAESIDPCTDGKLRFSLRAFTTPVLEAANSCQCALCWICEWHQAYLSWVLRNERLDAICPWRYLFLHWQNTKKPPPNDQCLLGTFIRCSKLWNRLLGLLLLAMETGNSSFPATVLSSKCSVLAAIPLARLKCCQDHHTKKYFELLARGRVKNTKNCTG